MSMEKFKRLAPYIWSVSVYKMVGINNDQEFSVQQLTGIGLHKSNLILVPCYYREGIIDAEHLIIRARNMGDGEGIRRSCKVKKVFPNIQFAILEIQDMVGNDDVLEIGEVDPLRGGERFFFLGAPIGGTLILVTEEVGFDCGETNMEFLADGKRCEEHRHSLGLQSRRSRIMGDSINQRFFLLNQANKGTYYEGYKNLHPMIPIIELNGKTLRRGCDGAPLFNNECQLVGIMFKGVGLDLKAIHVSALKPILKLLEDNKEMNMSLSSGKTRNEL